MAVVDENYVPLRNKSNDYLIDRKLQKTSSYTGIKGVSEQDAAVQDSQGPIADRTREHLGPTDLGIMVPAGADREAPHKMLRLLLVIGPAC